MNQNLNRISEILLYKVGRDVSIFNSEFVERIICERKNKTGVELDEDYIKVLEKDDHETRLLNDNLNNNTSQFFRDELTFSILEHTLLSRLIYENNGKREIRIWSAGCAKGQEPYSIGITFEELQRKLGKKIPYRIFATDISEATISHAKKGIYEFNAVEKVKLKDIDRYFKIKNDSYILKESVKNNISFSQQDLCDADSQYPIESIYGDFDLIFCCNVLIYYQPIQQKMIIEKLIQALTNNGFLIIGESERLLMTQYHELKYLGLNTSIFQLKARKKNET